MREFMAALFFKFLILVAVYNGIPICFADLSNGGSGFIYEGFRSANLSLDGIAELTDNGLLMLSNGTHDSSGHAFYPELISFKNSTKGEVFSFSTTFVFAIRSEFSAVSAEGLAFFISPTKNLPGGRQMGSLGVFNLSSDAGESNRHLVGVELDTFQNPNTPDLDNNHVAVDIESIDSVLQIPAGYYPDDRNNGTFRNLTLISGDPIQVWVDYDGTKKEIQVTLAPLKAPGKPRFPLINLKYNLSPVLQQSMYVGFSAASGPFVVRHYILGWSFTMNGGADQGLDLSKLPKLPSLEPKKVPIFFTIGLPLICLLTILAAVLVLIRYIRKQRKYAELLEDWEMAYGPHRFKYKDLYIATKGFKDTELLGSGGFGKVYKGVLGSPKQQIAVKKISHESKQGIREFVAEIVSIGRMSHRNLVPLLGYTRRKGELLLVYEYMPNGSLDRLLYGQPKFRLNWSHRLQIIKGVASGLFYLHEGWEQIVVHRDVKSSNVLLDGEFNGRLGDFGLARLYERGNDPQTTKVVGTVGYLAPEYYKTGRATTSSDVYAFGIFLFEVVCGKRPVEEIGPGEDMHSVEWVFSFWNDGRIVEAVDQKLGNDEMVKDEVELVLKLGLLCTHPDPKARPCMQKVMMYLNDSLPLPELSSTGLSASDIMIAYGKGFEDVSMAKLINSPSSLGKTSSTPLTFVEDSFLSGGR
ncbi:OLC1v1009591C1 [Oldenlandia corymbosa var. corymbosa]|uniref:non-specific serine/threonine protein kinase n=1 Tax=Oldenlandia corymbosa var. corymbosa TaxID=529605 RepID=A0AAV1DPA2_OLDCO|nr:OLC1v1009591C1 [Oldenlandia corymbosa var. corymbosa]